MPCSCSADQLDIFDEKAARRALRRYLDDGLGGSDALQIAAWAEEGGLDGRTVVEVGGGIGQIQADLLRRGAATGRIVELVAEYEGPAAELARGAGIADRSSFALADLLEEPDSVEPADIVVLRRVVCCTPDGPELLAAAAGKARRTVLASYPRDRLLVRLAFGLENLGFALFRKRFRNADPVNIAAYDKDQLTKLLATATDRQRLYVYLALNCGYYQADIGCLRLDEIAEYNGKPAIIRKRSKTSHQNDFEALHTLWPETYELLQREKAKPNAEGLALLSERGTPLYRKRPHCDIVSDT